MKVNITTTNRNIRTLEVEISGRVQGVWFRKYTKEAADKAGLVGTVRNTEQGTVICMIQGLNEDIDHFLQFCEKGSPLSKVDRVNFRDVPRIDAQDFRILR